MASRSARTCFTLLSQAFALGGASALGQYSSGHLGDLCLAERLNSGCPTGQCGYVPATATVCADAFRLAAAKFTGKVLQGLVQIDVRFCLGKQIDDVLANGIGFFMAIR